MLAEHRKKAGNKGADIEVLPNFKYLNLNFKLVRFIYITVPLIFMENGSLLLEELSVIGKRKEMSVLDYLIENDIFDHSIASIAADLNVSPNTVKKVVVEFASKGMVVATRKVGKAQLYQVNKGNLFVKLLMDFAFALGESSAFGTEKPALKLDVRSEIELLSDHPKVIWTDPQVRMPLQTPTCTSFPCQNHPIYEGYVSPA